MENNFSYIGLYVPWYAPEFSKGVWYPPFYPVPILQVSESPNSKEIARAQTPLQALDTRNLPSITAEEIKNLNSEENFGDSNTSKYFVIVSHCEDDIHKSLKYGIWTSTHGVNQLLNHTFLANKGKEKIYLFFSVIGSNMFVGIAEMISPVNFNTSFNGWYPDFSNLGYFGVRWIYVKDIRFDQVSFIWLPRGNNFYKIQDCCEIPAAAALKLVKAFRQMRDFKSILQDFEYYNQKEQIVLSSLD